MTSDATSGFPAACPMPLTGGEVIQMAHGGGGTRMHTLIRDVFVKAFDNPLLGQAHDGAVFEVGDRRLAFTTDSYVVRPLFFPGGCIGDLAVHGTANDLAMCGARPMYLSAGFVLEEGFPTADLVRIAEAMQAAAARAGVQVVTGDTKVVDRGKGDGVYINTAGVGEVNSDRLIGPAAVRPGDAVIVSGDVGRHGIAIMASREGLAFETAIESDCDCVAAPVLGLLEAGIDVHCLRDLTRGGLAGALVEIAAAGSQRIQIDQNRVPVEDGVRGACEILGLDPLYVANEGRFLAMVSEADAERAIEILRAHPVSSSACVIGRVSGEQDGRATLRGEIGSIRILDMLSGEQLPRIC